MTHKELIEEAKARGVIGLRCTTCDHVHGLGRLGAGCNAHHPYLDGETCEGWDLEEVKAQEQALDGAA